MIRGLGSLRTRIFLASTLLATLSIGAALYFVSALLTEQAEIEQQRDLNEAAELVDEQSATLFETVTRTARLIADLPRFKAALETRDAPTVEPIARDYLRQVGADLVVIRDRRGRRLATAGASTLAAGVEPPSLEGDEATAVPATEAFWPYAAGVLQVITVPVTIDVEQPETLGTLSLGYLLGTDRAVELKALTGADVAFALDGTIRASSFSEDVLPAVSSWFDREPRAAIVPLPRDDYSALARPLVRHGAASPSAQGTPYVIVWRSRTERMQTLGAVRATLGGVALATVGLAALISYALARTVTRPLATLTAHMREAAASGDLTRKVALPGTAWNDEDAVLLASTFNNLAESVTSAQRDTAQRERLSALGRLSTVIAHEIRNPLMIIKGALRQLARPDGTPADARDAATDINEEVDRLNRVVNEVLDFARPIRFDCAPAAVNDLCRSAREAVVAAVPEPDVALELDPAAGELITDAERVRLVLVNLLSNARAAVEARVGVASPLVVLASKRTGGHVVISVRDQGTGIAPDDLARVFDPYFTTRRTGSGLGLAISKNVVEGLGGTIAVASVLGVGTEIRVTLTDSTRGLAS